MPRLATKTDARIPETPEFEIKGATVDGATATPRQDSKKRGRATKAEKQVKSATIDDYSDDEKDIPARKAHRISSGEKAGKTNSDGVPRSEIEQESIPDEKRLHVMITEKFATLKHDNCVALLQLSRMIFFLFVNRQKQDDEHVTPADLETTIRDLSEVVKEIYAAAFNNIDLDNISGRSMYDFHYNPRIVGMTIDDITAHAPDDLLCRWWSQVGTTFNKLQERNCISCYYGALDSINTSVVVQETAKQRSEALHVFLMELIYQRRG